MSSSIFDDYSSEDEKEENNRDNKKRKEKEDKNNDNDSSNRNEKGKEGKDELELKQTKRQRTMKPVNEELLCSSDGIIRIYEEFPSLCKFYGRGNEKQDLKRLLDAYREWAFQLHPGVSSADLFLKCESLSSNVRIKNYMEDLRITERQRYLDETMNSDQ